MSGPLPLRDLAALFVAEADNVEELNLPEHLVEYIHSMQGVSLNLAYDAVEAFNAFLILLRDRNEELTDLDVTTQFLFSAQELLGVVDGALEALRVDVNAVITVGTPEWQEYALPLLTETQESLMNIHERLGKIVAGLEMGIEEIKHPSM